MFGYRLLVFRKETLVQSPSTDLQPSVFDAVNDEKISLQTQYFVNFKAALEDGGHPLMRLFHTADFRIECENIVSIWQVSPTNISFSEHLAMSFDGGFLVGEEIHSDWVRLDLGNASSEMNLEQLTPMQVIEGFREFRNAVFEACPREVLAGLVARLHEDIEEGSLSKKTVRAAVRLFVDLLFIEKPVDLMVGLVRLRDRLRELAL
jgi:hypothetical protein